MAPFMKLKSINPTLKQQKVAKKLSMSSSTQQRYEHDRNMLSPYRNPLNNNKRGRKISTDDFERPQLTSKQSSPIIETVKLNTSTKNKLKGGCLRKSHEFNDEYLDKKIIIIKTFQWN